MLSDAQEKLAKAAFQKTKLALDSAPNTWLAFRAAYELLMPVIVAADVIAKHLQDVDDEGSSVYSTELITYQDSKEKAGI